MADPFEQRPKDEILRGIITNARKNFRGYISACDPTYILSKVHYVITRKLEMVAEEKIKRLIISVPPRTGKSRLVNQEFPTWLLGKWPDKKIVLTSYAQDLAKDWSRKARQRVEEDIYKEIFPTRIAEDDAEVTNWGVQVGGKKTQGRYKAVGIGGALTGHGADCLIPGTLVATEAGDIPIEELDKYANSTRVLAYDERTRTTVFKAIKAVANRQADGFYRITTASGRVVEATANHPFFNGVGYTTADKLSVGDFLLRVSGIKTTSDSVAAIEFIPTSTVVWNIQVEGTENFFANGILTHNCLIVDDPVKDFEEAHSETMREKVWDWFWSVAYTRLSPGAAVIIIMTRWHVDDLVGRLTNPERIKQLVDSGIKHEPWEVINLPALAHDDDPLGRKPGEALFPERFSKEMVAQTKFNVGTYVWSALYEGNPVMKGGNYIKTENIRIVDEAPRGLKWVRFWDMATTTKSTSDFTAGLAGAIDPQDGTLYLRDMIRGKWEWPEARKRMVQAAVIDQCPVGMEAVGTGISAFQNLVEEMPPNIMLTQYTPDKDKLTRALPWVARVDRGKVALVRGGWNLEYLLELQAFPNGKNDDQVDATSGLELMLTSGNVSLIPVNIPDRKQSAMDYRRQRSLAG